MLSISTPLNCCTEVGNYTFSVDYISDGDGSPDTLFQEYSRPVYVFDGVVAEEDEFDMIWLGYTGSRWFGMQFNLAEMNVTNADLQVRSKEFHAFWNRAYNRVTYYVSDPTTKPTPVGVDWYIIGERGSQYGVSFTSSNQQGLLLIMHYTNKSFATFFFQAIWGLIPSSSEQSDWTRLLSMCGWA